MNNNVERYNDERYNDEQSMKREPLKIPEIDYSKMFKQLTILNNIKTYITYINTDNEIDTYLDSQV